MKTGAKSATRFAGLAALFGFTLCGICSFCSSLIQLDAAGNIVSHSLTRYGFQLCDGVGLPPKLNRVAAPAERK